MTSWLVERPERRTIEGEVSRLDVVLIAGRLYASAVSGNISLLRRPVDAEERA